MWQSPESTIFATAHVTYNPSSCMNSAVVLHSTDTFPSLLQNLLNVREVTSTGSPWSCSQLTVSVGTVIVSRFVDMEHSHQATWRESGMFCIHYSSYIYFSRLQNINWNIHQPYIILVLILYECETWSLIFREEHRLKDFENRVLRKVSRPERDETTGNFIRLHTKEFYDLYCSPNIVRAIKSRRMR
jgi:hypothetical protein